jgi:predicted RNA-binding protein (TIGR00451 family)
MKHLSGKDKKQLNAVLPPGYSVEKKDDIVENNEGILLKGNSPYLIKLKDKYIPHLKSVIESAYPICFIDNGAIPFLLKGADMMRPGIEKIEGKFKQGDIVLIKNQNYPKVIGIGYSELSSEEMQMQEKGKSINVIHYIKDSFY